MKKIYLSLTILVFLISVDSFAQKVITAEQVKADLKTSPESLSVTLMVPDSDFYIALVTDQIVENIYLNPCIDIKSDIKKNQKVLNVLEKHNLLDQLFIEVDNQYQTADSKAIFEPDETVLYLELFVGVNKSVSQIFVPMYDKEKAVVLIADLKKIFCKKRCFKLLQREIKT
ncbi:MAG: hypothetical protein ABJ092_14610 [Gillisia sp.]